MALDFSVISNAIREDDEEEDNDEDQKKETCKQQRADKIRKFKEEILNGKNNDRNIKESVSNRNSLQSENKARSNSQQVSQMRMRNSSKCRQIKEKRVSAVNKQRRRAKSKTVEDASHIINNDNDILYITLQQLLCWQAQINTSLNTTPIQQLQTLQLNLKQVIQENQEEDEESSSPIRKLSRNN